MKVQGLTGLKENQAAVTIVRCGVDGQPTKIEFVVSPMKIGFYHKIKTCGFDLPEPPKEILKDGNGRPILDPITREPRVVEKENDLAYIIKASKFNRKIDAIKLREALRNDPNVEWDETRKLAKGDVETNETIAASILNEIEEFGFSEDEITHILNKSEELSLVIDSDDLTEVFCLTLSDTAGAPQSLKIKSDNDESIQK